MEEFNDQMGYEPKNDGLSNNADFGQAIVDALKYFFCNAWLHIVCMSFLVLERGDSSSCKCVQK